MYSSALKVYRKTVLFFGSPMGLITIAAFYLENFKWYTATSIGVVVGLLAGVAFATPATIMQIVGTNRVVRSLNINREHFLDIYGVIHSSSFDISISLTQTHNQCMEVLSTIRQIKIDSIEYGKIHASTSISYLTFGEKITVSLVEGKGQTHVKVESRPVTVISFRDDYFSKSAI